MGALVRALEGMLGTDPALQQTEPTPLEALTRAAAATAALLSSSTQRLLHPRASSHAHSDERAAPNQLTAAQAGAVQILVRVLKIGAAAPTLAVHAVKALRRLARCGALERSTLLLAPSCTRRSRASRVAG
jgi:hypothetical protein